MHRSNKNAYTNVQHYFIDISVIAIAYFTAYHATKFNTQLLPIYEYMWIFIFYIPIWIFSMSSLGMYNDTTFKYSDRIVRNVLFSSFISLMFIAAMIFFVKAHLFSRMLYAMFAIFSIILLLIEHLFYTFFMRKRNHLKNIIIVGEDSLFQKFIYYLGKTDIRTNLISYLQIDELAALDELIKDNVVDEVYFAVQKEYFKAVEDYIYTCEEMGITVSMVLDLFDFKVAKTCLSDIGTLPVLTFHTVYLDRKQLFLKRTIDIVGALFGLFITGIVSIFIVPAIKLESKGPVLFKQNRVGLNGRVFKLYKFRSMIADAEQKKEALLEQNQVEGNLMFKIKDDPRITRVGKFIRATSIDELPQFINVLKGEMSLVGTRPPTVDEVEMYENHHFRRISIKPGITGMWQVSGRSEITDFDEVVRLDTYYIDNWSIFMDAKIILKTILVVFKKDGAM